MAESNYIHINEAVKKYGKTRQTFYNHINKDEIITRKLNNKLYLREKDIIRYMNEGNSYETEIVGPDSGEEVVSQQSPLQSARIMNLEQRVESVQSSIFEINSTLQSIPEFIQREVTATTPSTNGMDTRILPEIEKKMMMLEQYTQRIMKNTSARLKKINFITLFIVFIALNILVIGIL